MENKIRLFHVDYFKVVRDVFSICIRQNEKIALIGEDQDCVQILEHLARQPIDVVLVNLDNDGLSEEDAMCGVDICKQIRDRFPGIKVIVHSFHESAGNIATLMNAGVDGFISKNMGYEELLLVIDTVYKGGKFLNPSIYGNFRNADDFLSGAADMLVKKDGIFTSREIEVLKLLAKGLSTKDISELLFISLKTVETHRKNLVTKSGESNTPALISFAHKNGYL